MIADKDIKEVMIMAFKDRLRELRGKHTQKEMAALLEVKASSYTNWENGREPTYATLIHIAKYFDVSIDYLIDAGDRKKPELSDFCKEFGLTERALQGIKLLKNKTYNGLMLLTVLNRFLENVEEIECRLTEVFKKLLEGDD